MSAFIEDIGFFFTFVVELIPDLFEVIISNPALTIVTFGLLIVGAVFGYTSRLIKGR